MPTTIDPVIRFLDYLGLVDVVLPFILLFTMLYAFFEKTKVLGVEKGHPYHRINALASIVISLLVIGSANLLGIANTLVQYLGLLAVIVLAFAMILGLFGVQQLPQHKAWNIVFFVIFIIMSTYVFNSLGLFGNNTELVFTLFVVFFAILFILKVWRAKEPTPQLPAGGGVGHHKPAEQRPASPAAKSSAWQGQRPESGKVGKLGTEEEFKLGEEK